MQLKTLSHLFRHVHVCASRMPAMLLEGAMWRAAFGLRMKYLSVTCVPVHCAITPGCAGCASRECRQQLYRPH